MPISQIFLSDAEDQTLSPFLRHATGTVQAAFPNEEHTIYNKKTLRQFIADNYDCDVLWAYDSLCPYSYKADLGRFCLLNKLGGWYFDIAIRAVNPVALSDRIEFLAFRDIQRFSYTCLLYTSPSPRDRG
mgnify:CR=1 FL=1